MSLQVCEKQCDQCLFSKNRIVSAAAMKDILKKCAHQDTHFLCHKGTIKGKDIVCRGFYDRYDSKVIRMIKWLGESLIQFVTP